ncbi:ABC transporter permease [Natrarchaeobius chitinivorans]|nr:ABC transporter permease [Natrarchaeobius chitinivorans]
MDSDLRDFILRRVVQIPVVLFLVSVIVFYIIHLPEGGPEALLSGQAGDEAIREFRDRYNLNEPLYVQYLLWIQGILTGSLGTSITTNQPVASLIASRLPVTLMLGFFSVAISVMIAVPAGYISAVEQYTWKDHTATVLAFVGLSIPNFFLAILLIKLFSVELGWLPITASGQMFSDWSLTLKSMVLPSLALGTALAAHVTRILRSSMLDIYSEEYVHVARAKGLPEKMVNRSIVFKNALIPVITIVMLQMGYVLGATVIIEEVFAMPGLGRLMLNSVVGRDYPVMQAVVLLYATAYLVFNLIADVAYGLVDPRIKYGGEH